MTGAASGLFNTGRQVGGAIGAAVVGAVLQNRLVSAMHDNAVADSGRLPAGARANFINSFANAAHNGLEVGRGQSGGAQLPSGVSPALAHQLQGLIHDVSSTRSCPHFSLPCSSRRLHSPSVASPAF